MNNSTQALHSWISLSPAQYLCCVFVLMMFTEPAGMWDCTVIPAPGPMWWAPSRSSQRQHHGSCSDQGSPAMGLPRWCSGKESTRLCRRCGFDPWVRKIVWSRKQYYCILIFLPGKSHEQRSLVGYCLGGLKESDMTEQLSTAPADPQGWCRAILHLSSLIDGHCLLDGAGH